MQNNLIERIGMFVLAVSFISWVVVPLLVSLGTADPLYWLIPGITAALGFLILFGKVLFDRFTDEENTKYGDVKE